MDSGVERTVKVDHLVRITRNGNLNLGRRRNGSAVDIYEAALCPWDADPMGQPCADSCPAFVEDLEGYEEQIVTLRCYPTPVRCRVVSDER